jgi:hypothetical protein
MLRLLALFALAAGSLRAAAAPLPLIAGHPLPILVAPAAGEVDRFAADELARYLDRITGQTFAVRTADAAAIPPAAILVGRSFGEQFGEDLSDARLGEDGFLLKRENRRILIAGADERGTLYGAYAFLERLGCRWFAPNFTFYSPASGEHIPRLASPEIGELDVAEKPAFRWRKKYVEEGETHDLPRLIALVDWMAKVRLDVLNCAIDYQGEGRTKWDNWRAGLTPELKKRGLLIEVGGHGYQNFLPAARYFAQHPDWFGMSKGKRTDDQRIVFSTSNPDAVRTFVANVRSYLDAHPEIDIFDCRPPDSSHWSDAPADVALGTPTDRQLLLINRLMTELRPAFPHLLIRFEAYSDLIDPPRTVRPNGRDILMEFCPIRRSFQSRIFDPIAPVNEGYFAGLNGWIGGVIDPRSVTLNTYITKYQWRSLPVLVPHLISSEARRFEQMHLGGMASYAEPGAWAALELDHYFLARCLWHADLDPDAELKDYAQGRYGAAAGPTLAYLKLAEAVVPNATVIEGTHLELAAEQRYLIRFRAAARLMEEARRAAAGDSETLALIEKLDGARGYVENEIQLRAAFLEAGTTWRRDQITKIGNLIAERRKIIDTNPTRGLMVVDARTW